MDDLAQGRQGRALAQLVGGRLEVFADQVLDGLDVVAGNRLELAQALDVVGAEVTREGAQESRSASVSVGGAGQDRVVEQENQPLDLDVHARAVQARLGQVVRQGRGDRAVAAVQRAERFTPARQVRIAVGSGEQCHRVAHTPIFPERGAFGDIESARRFVAWVTYEAGAGCGGRLRIRAGDSVRYPQTNAGGVYPQGVVRVARYPQGCPCG